MIFSNLRSGTQMFRDALYKHIKDREGYSNLVYLDSLGKPTVGIGHLLSKEEKELYPVGAKLEESMIQEWFMDDITECLQACDKQCVILSTKDNEFRIALTSVNFQLGTKWFSKFPKTWKALCHKKYDTAIAEIMYKVPGEDEHSDWYKQTPTRVKDFTQAIEKLKEIHND